MSSSSRSPWKNHDEVVWHAGMVRKRGGRMSRWSYRHFTLIENRIEYRLSESSDELRGTFDLMPGCKVTNVRCEGRDLYTIWIVWPRDKLNEESQETYSDEEGDDDIVEDDDITIDTVNSKDKFNTTNNSKVSSKLCQQQLTSKLAKRNAEKQIARHEVHDNHVGALPKIAGVAFGGLIISALTAGVGLLPYIALVGGIAVAGGSSAVLSYRKPMDSRLIIACTTLKEALIWKKSVENVITFIEKRHGPKMPAFVDVKLISILAKLSCDYSYETNRWILKNYIESDIRILELTNPPINFRIQRSHVAINSTPLEAFLTLMESCPWPCNGGDMRVIQVVDSNTDIVCVNLRSVYKSQYIHRKLYLTRFWRMTENGCYFITFNGISISDIIKNSSNTVDNVDNSSQEVDEISTIHKNHQQPLFTALLTILPRKDHTKYDNDIPETLVVCSIQVSTSSSTEFHSTQRNDKYEKNQQSLWMPYECDIVVNDFLRCCVAELRYSLGMGKLLLVSHDNERTALENNLILSKSTIGSSKACISSLYVESAISDQISCNNGLGPCKNHSVDVIHQTKSKRKLKQQEIHFPEKSTSTRHESKNIDNSSEIYTVKDVNSFGGIDSSNSMIVDEKTEEILKKQVQTRLDYLQENEPFEGHRTNDLGQGRARVGSFSITRSSGINNTASVLRGQIAAKEYELQRLQQKIQNRSYDKETVEKEKIDAQTLLRHQVLELQTLKIEYNNLTGSAYEKVFIRRSINTSRHVGNLVTTANTINMTSRDSASCNGHDAETKAEEDDNQSTINLAHLSRYPSHWYYSQGNTPTKSNSRAPVFVIVIILILFLMEIYWMYVV